ncbi:Acetyltransferase, GNAT family [Sulfitobacter noctilucae]|uniref:GNAT family N-acetyltransferase n=1 Tax=Sulfitobacter noctilucae TaxID=1342302 RepID=UPI0004694D42|nr:GNAT family N-acetyltransferase [Sulfitobacter noctilucae]KIN70836.1 Acetyltransferase, GNAT family [Sulfitobacter noctilucae]
MQIEPARAADIPAIAALWHAGWHQGHAAVVPAALVACRVPEEFAARSAERLSQTYVARGADGLMGFFMVEGDELYQFYVAAASQGQGVAARMMAAAETALAGRRAWLACSIGNDRAAAFYAKAGWLKGPVQIYPTETAQGTCDVSVWRFEKDLRG